MAERANIFPVEGWRKAIGYHPWHFWGLVDDGLLKLTSACNKAVPEYSWQAADMPSRDMLRQAIITAESRLREHLNYSVGQHFITETLRYPRPTHYGHEFLGGSGSDGRWMNVQLAEGYVRGLGVETLETIDATATVAVSDDDGDGYDETVTITASTTVTDPDQIAVYFGASDRLDGDPVSERYRIAPLKVTISGGTVTIKGRRWQFVRPIRYEGLGSVGIDPSGSNVFSSTVAIMRRYNDPAGTTTDTAQAVLVWETAPYPEWATHCGSGNLVFADGSADPAAEAYAIARCVVRDGRLGEIGIGAATYDADSGQWTGTAWGTCRQPDRVIVRYHSGVKLSSLESATNSNFLAGDWDKVISRLACAELPDRQWSCDKANQEIYHWKFDLARAAGANDEQYRIADENLTNPFGTARGAVYAWNRVRNLVVTRAVLLG